MEYISGRLMRPVFCIMNEKGPMLCLQLNVRSWTQGMGPLVGLARYFLRSDTMLNVSWAIMNSSLVGITMILTGESSREMKRSLPW